MNHLLILLGFLGIIIAWRLFLRGIGRVALNRVVSDIQLAPISDWTASAPDVVERYRQAFAASGFADAGTFAVRGIDGLVVQFLIKADPSMYGVIYDHSKKSMLWCNVVMLFSDDTSTTLTDQPDRGLAQRPGHAIVHCPGDSVETLSVAAVQYAQGKRLRALQTAELPRLFEQAYRDGLAWHKQRGVSAKEVINVAKTRPSN